VAARRRNRDRASPETSAELPAPAVRQNASLNEFAREWQKQRSPRTRHADAERLRAHVLPLLGARRVRDIRSEDVADVVRRMLAKKGMNVKSARNAFDVFAELLGDALSQGLLSADPRALPADLWPVEQTPPAPRFSAAEARALGSDERLDLDQRMMNLLAFHSGLGSAEICGLRFDDWSRRVRTPIAPELSAALERWQHGGFEALYGRPPSADDWLVPRRSDVTMPHTEGSAYKAFRRACVTLGIKTRSPRAAQNTFEDGSSPAPIGSAPSSAGAAAPK
jgi:integrase